MNFALKAKHLLLFVVVACPGCNTTQPISTIHTNNLNPVLVVSDVRQSRYSRNSISNTAQIAEGLISTELRNKGYSIVSRRDLAKLVEEIKFSQEGLSDSRALKFGEMVSAKSVMVINIEGFNDMRRPIIWVTVGNAPPANQPMPYFEVTVSARLINVETGVSEWTSVASANRHGNQASYAKATSDAIRKLGSSLPQNHYH